MLLLISLDHRGCDERGPGGVRIALYYPHDSGPLSELQRCFPECWVFNHPELRSRRKTRCSESSHQCIRGISVRFALNSAASPAPDCISYDERYLDECCVERTIILQKVPVMCLIPVRRTSVRALYGWQSQWIRLPDEPPGFLVHTTSPSQLDEPADKYPRRHNTCRVRHPAARSVRASSAGGSYLHQRPSRRK